MEAQQPSPNPRNDYFCEKLLEVGVINMQLPAHPTVFLSIHIYNRAIAELHLAEESDDVKYIIAMASLALAARIMRLNVNIEDILISFYPIIMHEEVRLCEPTEEFLKLKGFIEDMFALVFRKLCKTPILCILPTEYLFHLVTCLREFIPTNVCEDFNIMEMSWALTTDLFLTEECPKFNYGHIAVAAIYVTLKKCCITIPGCPNLELLDWAKGVIKDITLENIEPIIKLMCPAGIAIRKSMPLYRIMMANFAKSPGL